MTKTMTITAVNLAIKRAGGEERLRRGRGYFYFHGGNAGA